MPISMSKLDAEVVAAVDVVLVVIVVGEVVVEVVVDIYLLDVALILPLFLYELSLHTQQWLVQTWNCNPTLSSSLNSRTTSLLHKNWSSDQLKR
jgi:hypothetical protein